MNSEMKNTQQGCLWSPSSETAMRDHAPDYTSITTVYLPPILTFAQTLNIGAEFHHLYLTLTRFPFTVTCLNVLSAWNTVRQLSRYNDWEDLR